MVRISSQINKKECLSRHIMVKPQNISIKEKILKALRRKRELTSQEWQLDWHWCLNSENERYEIVGKCLQCTEAKNICHPRILYYVCKSKDENFFCGNPWEPLLFLPWYLLIHWCQSVWKRKTHLAPLPMVFKVTFHLDLVYSLHTDLYENEAACALNYPVIRLGLNLRTLTDLQLKFPELVVGGLIIVVTAFPLVQEVIFCISQSLMPLTT